MAHINLGQGGGPPLGGQFDLDLDPDLALEDFAKSLGEVRVRRGCSLGDHDKTVAARRIATRLADELARKAGMLIQHGPDPLGEDVDAPDLDHIVRTSKEALDPLEIDIDGRAAQLHLGDVMGIEADNRIEVVLEETGHHHVADCAVSHDLAGVDIADFKILGVLHHIEAIAVGTFTRDDAGVAHAVPVKTGRATPGLRDRVLVFPAHLAGDHPNRNIDAGNKSLFSSDFGQLLDVVCKADNHIGAEVAHQFNLLGGSGFNPGPCGQKHRTCPVRHGLAHIVAAIDHAVAIDGVDNIAGSQSLPAIESAQHQRLNLSAFGSEEQHLGFAGCPRGGVQDDRRTLGVGLEPGEVTKGRCDIEARHDVGLVKHRQVGQVIQ